MDADQRRAESVNDRVGLAGGPSVRQCDSPGFAGARHEDDDHRQRPRSTTDPSLGLPADLKTTGTGGASSVTTQSFFSHDGSPSITDIDQSSITWTTLWMTGNFDTTNKSVQWNASPRTASLPESTRSLPASLYYAAMPAWWPTGQAWPWVGPDLTPMVGVLPAKSKSSSFNYGTSSDPQCTLDSANQCCYAMPAAGCSPLNN